MLTSHQSFKSGCGKRKAPINLSMVAWKGSIRYWNSLEDSWPCAGGFSALNAIGTQLGDLINSGLIQWRLTVHVDAVAESGRNLVSKHQIQIHPEYGE